MKFLHLFSHRKFSLLILWQFLSCFCLAQIDTIALPQNLNTIEWQLPLINKALIADTLPTIIGLNETQKIDFKLFTKDSVFIQDEKCAWLRFHVKNPSINDTAYFLINFNNRIHFVYLFSDINGTIDSIAGGRLTDYYKRRYQKNKSCFPIALPPQYSGSFWLKFNNFSENRSNLQAELVSIKMEEKVRVDEVYTYTFNHTIEAIYLSLFVILALFATRIGYIWLDEGYKWYAIYIGSIALFYFRDFENYNNNHVIFFSYFSSWHFKIEATICYITYISYMIFIQKFLDLKQFYPRLNRLVTLSINVLIGCLILDLLVHSVWGLAVSFRLFIYVRLVFFIYYFVVLFKIATGTASALSRFVVLGTFCMLLPGVTSNVAMAFGGDNHSIFYGLFVIYEFPTFKIPMYNTQTGVLLEALFFVLGLSWKARRELDELKKLKFNQVFQTNNSNLEIEKRPLPTESGQVSIEALQKGANTFELNEASIECPKSEDNQANERIDAAFIQLENEFCKQGFTVKKWAQLSFLSVSHFSKLITEQTNEAPLTHIQRRRLQSAQQLLSTTDLTIAEIASQCGYDDSNYFSRIFKKTFQLTPSEWQKQCKSI